ncbi:hypothetical protein BT638P6_00017 [Bacteroides phage BT638P6]|nr:hypothetical protein BT638P6_00017 [Bacteroides phage BT638P6]
MKYSINSSGYIVAERDIYSLGGFIPKNSVGCKVANGDQISQDGDCWVAGGDISGRPDVRVKDNAYVGNWVPSSIAVHTDVVTEFSGNTVIPGRLVVRCASTDLKNNFFARDSFIGISMDVLCGPVATATAFPFVQGRLDHTKPAGTPTANMVVADANSCFSNTVMRCGNDTQIYVPANMTARVIWVYNNVSNATAYSGESELLQPGLKKVSHPAYKAGLVVFSSASAMTPTDLLATGAKILGHISDSVNVDIRPESASGSYVMDKSSFIISSSNFGLATSQLRLLAGGLYNTSMYTNSDRDDYQVYGTFHNVQRLEYTKYLGNSHRTNVSRDTYISAYDCPLLRVDSTTYNDALAAKGDLVLRRCIVPKAEFQDDVINGNTYEDIDFSCANEDLGFTIAGYTRFISSHKQGIYRLSGGPSPTGFVSHKGNLADTARLYQAEVYLPLDGSIMEQGSYGAGGLGSYYESSKSDSPIRVRTGKPLPTFGLVFPSLPAGYSVKAFYYLDDGFIIRSTSTDPTGLDTTYPYVVMLFRRDNDSAINVTDFVALNRTLRMIDHTKAPEITGSSYVGAGCTVRGDVKLIGDPYVNRLFDVNMWERGTMGGALKGTDYESGKAPTGAGNRFRLVDSFPVEPGDTISCAEGCYMQAHWYDGFGVYSSQSNWDRTFTVTGNNRFLGIVLKKATNTSNVGGLITKEDLALANVKYVRAFKKRRYIVNELDRTSPEDILLSVDYWEQGTAGGGQADAGKTYEELKAASGTTVRLKRPVNVSPVSSISSAAGFSKYIRVLDAVTKFHLGESLASAKMALLAVIVQKDPSGAIAPSEVPNSRLVLEFVPQPRIVVPYGSGTLFISGPKIRMYDNAVLSRNLNQEGDIVLQGDAVMGYDFNPGSCMCSNGHHDAIIKLP